MSDPTLEKFTEQIMELRLDINVLSEKMMKLKKLTIDIPATQADLMVIENARTLIQKITEELK